MPDFSIRKSTKGEAEQILSLYPKAFPEEDLVPLVRSLLDDDLQVLSLVAAKANEIVGHIIFTPCFVEGTGQAVSLLGPLCIAPEHQRQGLGTRLMSAGIEQLTASGVHEVLVLGDPAYYSRLGFLPRARLQAPYQLPEEWAEAWQYLSLATDAAPLEGQLQVPAPWQAKELWLP